MMSESFTTPAVMLSVVVLLVYSLTGCALAEKPLRPHGDNHGVYAVASKAQMAYAQQQWPAAQRYYEKLTQLAPTDAQAWFRLGNTYTFLAAFDSAETAFNAASRLSPQAMKPKYNLATVYLMQARVALRQSLDHASSGHPLLRHLERQLQLIEQLLQPPPAEIYQR